MITFPNAKINLGLVIGGTRADGYHNLDTLFYPLHQLCDLLEIIEADEDKFVASGIPVQGDASQNLVLRALRLLRESYDIPPVAIYLRKQIPMGAGLGGGSADAAFAIRMLNEMFNLKMTIDTMKRVARQLGADCPLFIDNCPALGKGIGDELERFELNLNDYKILVLKGDVFVSTAEAYRGVPMVDGQPNVVRDIVSLPVEEWKGRLENSFEVNVFAAHNVLRQQKQMLYDNGAVYASMSGSGSSVFGIFKQVPTMLIEDLKSQGLFVHVE